MKYIFQIVRSVPFYLNAPDGGAGGGETTETKTPDANTDKTGDDTAKTDAQPSILDGKKPAPGADDAADKAKPEGEDKAKAPGNDDQKDKADGKGDEPDPNAVVPEDGVYTFQLPDGIELDATVAEAASPIFKELGITVGQANGLAGFFATLRSQEAAAQAEGWTKTNAEWVKQAQSDPAYTEVGHETAFRMANDALDKYGSPELIETLKQTGMANNPHMIRAFFKMATATLGDKTERGDGAGSEAAPIETRMYGKTTPTTKKG